MRRSGSDLARWVAIAGIAALLAGCGSDPGEVASEPGVVLSSTSADDANAADPSGAGAADDHPEDDDRDDDTVLRNAPTVADRDAELEVDDQRGDGTSVRIAEVRYSSGTGIVGIYDAGLALLGWAAVPSGSHGTTIDLDRRLGSSQELVAVLHRDDGDGFLGPGDAVVVDEGEQVSEDFDYLLD